MFTQSVSLKHEIVQQLYMRLFSSYICLENTEDDHDFQDKQNKTEARGSMPDKFRVKPSLKNKKGGKKCNCEKIRKRIEQVEEVFLQANTSCWIVV